MLDVAAYNAKRLSESRFTMEHIEELVRYWQYNHDLVVDGKAGPKTVLSLTGGGMGSQLMQMALRYAIADIGKGETAGNNRGQWLDSVRLGDGTGLRLRYGPWCASVLSFWFTRAEHTLGTQGLIPWKSSRHARTLGKWLAKNATTNDLPEPGAIGIYARGLPGTGKGHAVIFEKYDPVSGDAVTIEGNVGAFPSLVKRCYYPDGKWRKRLIGIYSF